MRVKALVAVLGILLCTEPISAQQSEWLLTVEPRVGFFTPDKAMGVIAPGGPLIEMRSGASVGVSVGVKFPFTWLSVRGTLDRTLGTDLYTRSLSGSVICESDCSEHSPIFPLAAGSSVLNVGADVLLFPPDVASIQPYAIGGLGIKRYDLGNGTYSADPRYRFGGKNAGLAVHAGFGLEFPIGSTTVTLEAVDYVSGLGQAAPGTLGDEPYRRSLSQRAFDGLKHDVFFTVGLKVPLLRW